jgi:hypothetical protein
VVGTRDAPAHLGHRFGKAKVGGVGKDAAVDMALRHIDKGRRPLQRGHRADHLHRDAPGRAIGPLQHRTVLGGKVQLCHGQAVQGAGRPRQRTGRSRQCGLLCGCDRKRLCIKAQHGDGPVEHLARDHGTKRDDILGLGNTKAAGAIPFSARSSITPLPLHDPRVVGITSTLPAIDCPQSGWCASITIPVTGSTPPQKLRPSPQARMGRIGEARYDRPALSFEVRAPAKTTAVSHGLSLSR